MNHILYKIVRYRTKSRGFFMNCIYIGAFIKQRRKELKLTQEQVCSGICDPVTLSRIENGKQTTSKSVISALLQRLGMPEARYYVLESKNELEIEALKKDIIACGVTRNVSLGFEKLSQLENLTVSDDHLTRQFILRSKALLGSFDKRYTYDEQIDMLMSAIHLTVPDFNVEEINKCLYAFDEIKAIIQIANIYLNLNRNDQAIDIFYQLLKYVRNHYQEVITSGKITLLVLYNYARALDLCERYEDGMKLAKEGRDACIQYGHYQTLPGCLEIYAECCHFLGMDDESTEAYYQAYYLCKLIGRKEDLEITRNEAKKYLNIDFKH